ncbi:sensor histidine kinase [Paraburkholderia mimosarum]|uniref:sensor histidine kinase n=1 Tax=Paraburkholderia mimosarum TaxID=312026 RepID=UPI000685EEFE|nr:sensor histidine kinase [Paraburkholderia mimosarum]
MRNPPPVEDERLSVAATLVAEQRRRIEILRASLRSTAQAEELLATFEFSLDSIELLRAASSRKSGARLANGCEEPVQRIEDRTAGPSDSEGIALRIQTAIAQERKEIAQALHDDLGQELALLKAQIHDLATTPRDQSARQASAMLNLQSRIDTAISSVRRVVFAVRPLALDGQDLAEAIEALASEYRFGSGLAVRCLIRVKTGSFSEAASAAIYRIVQEALTNAARHGRASHASIELYRFRDIYVLRMQDDGVGAPTDVRPGSHSLGLRGMQERVRLLGGRIRIETSPGNGFTIAIQLPEKSLVQPPG